MKTFARQLIDWDIETGPESEDILRKFYEPLPEFRAEACKKKYATARKPGTKGEEFIAEKRAEHEQDAGEHWDNYVSKAALNPLIGRIVAIGWRENGESTMLTASSPEEEKAIIAQFLEKCASVALTGGVMEGFNIDEFDLRFVFVRALKYGLKPHTLRRGRYWHPMFRDLLNVWRAGNRTLYIKLDKLAEFLGTAHRKNGDGAHFAEIFATDPEKALAYLENDLIMTEEVGAAIMPAEDVVAASPQAERVDDIGFESVGSVYESPAFAA